MRFMQNIVWAEIIIAFFIVVVTEEKFSFFNFQPREVQLTGRDYSLTPGYHYLDGICIYKKCMHIWQQNFRAFACYQMI